jgi:hypothetical protein
MKLHSFADDTTAIKNCKTQNVQQSFSPSSKAKSTHFRVRYSTTFTILTLVYHTCLITYKVFFHYSYFPNQTLTSDEFTSRFCLSRKSCRTGCNVIVLLTSNSSIMLVEG